MEKIALIAINSRSSHSNPTLFTIKKILKEKNGLIPQLLEMTINDHWKSSLSRMLEMQASTYLFSVYIWNREYIEKTVPLLKAMNPEIRIIMGGPEITYNLTYWEKKDWVETLVAGQAEAFLPHLFSFRKKIYYSTPTAINDIPFPYELADKSILEGRLVYYEASRGCLFNCSYCLSACESRKPEYRSIKTVKKEMSDLIALNPKIVKMVDRTFNSQKIYAREIWQFLINIKSPVPFHFEIHPLFLEDEDFSILAKAPEGLFFFEVGIQSTDREVLRAVNRPWNRAKEKENIDKLCTLKNIHTHLDQIVPLPGDTPEKAINSFNEIMAHRPDDFQLGFLKILPGTPLAAQCEKYAFISTPFPPYEVLGSDTFPHNSLRIFYRIEAEVNRFYNSNYFTQTLNYMMNQFDNYWNFFKELSLYTPENTMSKQWSVLGESLLEMTKKHFPEMKEYIIDLLRYDWCPFASGQTYPPFLLLPKDHEIKEIRRRTYTLFEKEIKGFTRKGFNHSILFVPFSERMKKETDKRITLFYHEGKGKKAYHLIED